MKYLEFYPASFACQVFSTSFCHIKLFPGSQYSPFLNLLFRYINKSHQNSPTSLIPIGRIGFRLLFENTDWLILGCEYTAVYIKSWGTIKIRIDEHAEWLHGWYHPLLALIRTIGTHIWQQGLHSSSLARPPPSGHRVPSEMEFLSGILEVSWHKLESSHIQVFVWFSALVFPFYKMLFMNRLEFSGFAFR